MRPKKTTMQKREAFVAQESEIYDELYSYFTPDNPLVILDIGACEGLSSCRYHKMFPHSFVHAFEPRSDNCSIIAENFKHFGVTGHVYQIALSDKKGKTRFFESYGQAKNIQGWDTGNKSSSMLMPARHKTEHSWCKFFRRHCMTELLDSYGIAADFIHIDVQGAELMVFKGGEKTLESALAVYVEVSNVEMYKGQPLKIDVIKYLQDRGYRLIKDLCGDAKQGDIFMAR